MATHLHMNLFRVTAFALLLLGAASLHAQTCAQIRVSAVETLNAPGSTGLPRYTFSVTNDADVQMEARIVVSGLPSDIKADSKEFLVLMKPHATSNRLFFGTATRKNGYTTLGLPSVSISKNGTPGPGFALTFLKCAKR